MKTIGLLLTLSTCLAACAVPEAAPPAVEPEAPPAAIVAPLPPERAHVSVPYAMRGAAVPGSGANGWLAVLDEGRMLISSPTSAGWYVATRPQPEVVAGRHVFRTAEMTITVEPGACTVPEQRTAQPDRVTLVWDGGSFEGCGGPRTGPQGVENSLWELVRLGNQVPPPDRSPAATLGFSADGRVGGTHVCNSLGSTVRWRRDGSFVRGPEGYAFVGTQIGCYGPGHDIGQRFWNMVATAKSWRQEGDRLFITGAGGEVAELRFLIGR